MKIGICGGTFDPFHCGHLDPILAVRGAMEWDRVIYVPAFVQPFKQDRATASPYHRFAMTVLGTQPHDGLFVSPIELERGQISYTVDTLRALRAEFPNAKLDWIIGDDNLADLPKWKSIDEIATLANFVVLSRSAAAEPPLWYQSGGDAAALLNFVHNPRTPVSSTEIRRRIAAGESIEELVPAPVSRYIHHYDLYRKASS